MLHQFFHWLAYTPDAAEAFAILLVMIIFGLIVPVVYQIILLFKPRSIYELRARERQQQRNKRRQQLKKRHIHLNYR